MSLRKFVFLFCLSVLLGQRVPAQIKTVAERLGYPADTKLLIIHADDLAIAHSEDAASFEALDKGAVTSRASSCPDRGLRKSPNMPRRTLTRTSAYIWR